MARTKGAVSCVLVKMDDLSSRFGPEALIPVNARFARENNLERTNPIYSTRDAVKASGEQPEVTEVE